MSAESNLKTLREESQAWKQLKAERDELLTALKTASAYMLNAKIDFQTGVPEKTATDTIEGGLKLVGAAIAKCKGA